MPENIPPQTVSPFWGGGMTGEQLEAWTKAEGERRQRLGIQNAPGAYTGPAPSTSVTPSSDSTSWWSDVKNVASNVPGGLPAGIPGLPGAPTQPGYPTPTQGGYTPTGQVWMPGAGQVSMPPGGPSAGLLGLSMTTLALIGAGLYFGLPYLKKM